MLILPMHQVVYIYGVKHMKNYTSSVSPKGQITLPLEIRKRFGIKPKDKVIVTVDGDDAIKIKPLRSRLAAGFGSVPPLKQPLTWKEIEEIAREEHARKVAAEGL